MINVRVYKATNYPLKSSLVKKRVKEYLEASGIVSDCEVSIALVGKERMKKLSSKYIKDNLLHNVLSFTENEIQKKFIYPPGKTIYLGEVAVCYPKAVEEAKRDNVRIEQKVLALVEHGLTHLMGVHHK